MDDRKWNLAWSRFEALRTHPPKSWDESAVSQYHEVIGELESATTEDLSAFRIPDSELKQRIVSGTYATHRRPATWNMSDKRYCDEQFVKRQMEGIVLYFQSLQPPSNARKMGF